MEQQPDWLSEPAQPWLPIVWKGDTLLSPLVRYPRRGSMTGYPVRIYNPEEIKGMSEEELMKCIEHDLYTNAYDEQKRRGPVAFRGKNLAENLETALYLCPCCGKMEGLQSRGDYFFCSCGLKQIIRDMAC